MHSVNETKILCSLIFAGGAGHKQEAVWPQQARSSCSLTLCVTEHFQTAQCENIRRFMVSSVFLMIRAEKKGWRRERKRERGQGGNMPINFFKTKKTTCRFLGNQVKGKTGKGWLVTQGWRWCGLCGLCVDTGCGGNGDKSRSVSSQYLDRIDNLIKLCDFFNFPTSLHMVTLDTYLIYGSYKFFGPMWFQSSEGNRLIRIIFFWPFLHIK